MKLYNLCFCDYGVKIELSFFTNTTLTFSGKAGAGMGFVMVYTFTAELYPTNLRSQALGVCSTVARVFSLGASYVPSLGAIWGPLPGLVLGVPTVIASILSLSLDETMGKDLPQNLKEGIELKGVDNNANTANTDERAERQ